MSQEQRGDVRVPEDEHAVIAMVREDMEADLTEQQKNLAIAQAELIGDL